MLRVITLFSGYDSQCLALNRLGLPYELAAWCEIDKHAITAHNALFPQWKERNLGDVSKVDWAEWHKQYPQPIDLLTYSSPCQDFSSAGLQRGGEEGSGTRSGLLWETERAVRELRPRHLVFENVGGLVSDKFIDLFNRWQARLNGYGYTNFSQLMNAKDYGVPQNRLRIFMVSVLDCQCAYYFPKPFRLERRLKDVLEQNVDERYYLSDERVAKLMAETEIHRERGNGFAFRPHTPEEIASTVKCSGIGDKTDNYVAEPAVIDDVFYDREPRVYDTVSPTIRSSHDIFKVAEPCISSIRGRADGDWHSSEHQQRLEIGGSDTSNSLTSVAKDNMVIEPLILTPIRTEYGKAVRKQYGDNNLPESRHNLTSLKPKTDGTSNALTSVAKDNLVIEPVSDRQANIKAKVMPNGDIRCYQDIPGKPGISEMQYTNPNNECPTVTCEAQIKVIEPRIIEDFYGTVRDPRVYTDEAPTLRADRSGLMATEGIRIRLLTERELYRLMDVEEKDIDTLLAAPIPRTQHAKLAGNSIAIACLYYIFRNIFVDTEPAAGTQTTLF